MTRHEKWEIENVISDGEYLAECIRQAETIKDFQSLQKMADSYMNMLNQVFPTGDPDNPLEKDYCELSFYLSEALIWKESDIKSNHEVQHLAEQALSDYLDYLHSKDWLTENKKRR